MDISFHSMYFRLEDAWLHPQAFKITGFSPLYGFGPIVVLFDDVAHTTILCPINTFQKTCKVCM